MLTLKQASKLVHYYQTDSVFAEKINSFHETENVSSFKEIIIKYTDLQCSADDLWRFVCSLIENYEWKCDCSPECKKWIIFSLAGQKARNAQK